MGMAAGWHLAQQGVRTLLIDAFHPPHTMGSHHGETRIIRHAYGEGRQYVPLALRAQELWLDLQAEAGTRLFAQTGVLSLGPAGSPFMEEVVRSSVSFDLPLEVLDTAEIRRRWPGWRVPDDYVGCLETSSGVLFSEDCIRAMRQLGEARGMQVLVDAPVDDIRVDGQGASVRAGSSVYTAERVIVTAGAWAKRLLATAGLDVPLRPTRKAIAWFACDENLYGAAEFPAFTCGTDTAHYYGFPSFNGSGLKVGRHDGGQTADPDTMERTFGAYPEDEGDLRRFLRDYLPRANGRLLTGKTCVYTMTPDEHFIIDRHPERPQLLFACGFSGHGFKFASAVGEVLAQLAVADSADLDVSTFSLRRFQH